MKRILLGVAFLSAVVCAGSAFARPPAYCYYTQCDVVEGANGTYLVCGTSFVC